MICFFCRMISGVQTGLRPNERPQHRRAASLFQPAEVHERRVGYRVVTRDYSISMISCCNIFKLSESEPGSVSTKRHLMDIQEKSGVQTQFSHFRHDGCSPLHTAAFRGWCWSLDSFQPACFGTRLYTQVRLWQKARYRLPPLRPAAAVGH